MAFVWRRGRARVLDGELDRLRGIEFLPVPTHGFIEDDIASDMNSAVYWVEHHVRLAAGLISEEYHRCAPIVELLEVRTSCPHVRDPTEHVQVCALPWSLPPSKQSLAHPAL